MYTIWTYGLLLFGVAGMVVGVLSIVVPAHCGEWTARPVPRQSAVPPAIARKPVLLRASWERLSCYETERFERVVALRKAASLAP